MAPKQARSIHLHKNMDYYSFAPAFDFDFEPTLKENFEPGLNILTLL